MREAQGRAPQTRPRPSHPRASRGAVATCQGQEPEASAEDGYCYGTATGAAIGIPCRRHATSRAAARFVAWHSVPRLRRGTSCSPPEGALVAPPLRAARAFTPQTQRGLSPPLDSPARPLRGLAHMSRRGAMLRHLWERVAAPRSTPNRHRRPRCHRLTAQSAALLLAQLWLRRRARAAGLDVDEAQERHLRLQLRLDAFHCCAHLLAGEARSELAASGRGAPSPGRSACFPRRGGVPRPGRTRPGRAPSRGCATRGRGR